MEQLRKGARFKSEPALRIFVVKRVLLQYLERYVALESRILGAKHHAHTTLAKAFDDLVPAERLTDHSGCGMGWGNQCSRSLFRATAPGKSADVEPDHLRGWDRGALADATIPDGWVDDRKLSRNGLRGSWPIGIEKSASGYQFLRLFLTTAHPAPGRCDH